MNEFIRKVDNLPEMDKYRIWIRYLKSHYSLKYTTQVLITTERDEEHFNKLPGHGAHRCQANWKYNTILTTWKADLTRGEVLDFINFCKNYKKVELGDWWKEQGFAQKEWIDYPTDSIYYWYTRI